MSDQPATSPSLTASAAPWLEQAILAFEQRWRAERPASIAEALADYDARARPLLASELAAVDMEFRWQASAQGRPPSDALGGQPTWRDYALQIPEIGGVGNIPPALLAEEYRVRQLWGDQPSRDHFVSAYPAQLTRLPKWLSQIDDELQADDVPVAESAKRSPRVPADPDPRAPLPWSDYLLQEHLGGGGFGKVYRALQKSLDRPVAVKALHKARQRDPQAIEQFIQEARLLARLRHPGVVGVHGLGRYPGGGYFLVLDLVEGEDLQRRIERGPLPIAEAVRIGVAAAEAIQHAHERGVLHGDLKPGNVLVDAEGAVTVTDFGLGHLLPTADNDSLTAPFHGGTLAYLAPEVARGETISVAADVYGLGAVLYALLTAQPPREGASAEAVLTHLVSGSEVCPVATARPDLPPKLNSLVMRCLQTYTSDRFAAAAEVAAELRTIARSAQ